jgi:NADH:ubiquinone oxidoreductase subunit 6 (subunit J)
MGLFLLLMVARTVWRVEGTAAAPDLAGTPQAIGASLFTDYLLPFELTSLLILIALMGAVVFAKKEL